MTTLELDKKHIWHPFTQVKGALQPIAIARGKGAYLYDEDGKSYLDMISSWWVNMHGHAHPDIADAIAKQAHTLEQVIFADFTHAPAAQIASKLTALLPEDLTRVFFSDDGSTSVEVALKLAIQYWRNHDQPQRTKFISMEGGYHGDTFGAMAVGKGSGFFKFFEELQFDVETMPFPETWEEDEHVEEKEEACLNALREIIDRNKDQVAALILEPLIQGAGGMRMCRPIFLSKLEKELKSHGILLILDEIMVGFGRTGKMFAFEHTGDVGDLITPDLICLSKGLTGGFMAMSVTIATEKIFDAFLGDSFDRAFVHGHSYTANPIGCAAALASLEVFQKEKTFDKVQQIESCHREALTHFQKHPKLEHVRQQGTILAMNLKVDDGGYTSSVGKKMKAAFIEKGFLIRPLGNVLYLLPPYCVTKEELQKTYEVIDQVLETI